MKLYETNSALGYNEIAYFIKCEEGYLCIFENQNSTNFWKSYQVGELFETNRFEEYEINEVKKEFHNSIIEKSPLAGTFLFNKFLKEVK